MHKLKTPLILTCFFSSSLLAQEVETALEMISSNVMETVVQEESNVVTESAIPKVETGERFPEAVAAPFMQGQSSAMSKSSHPAQDCAMHSTLPMYLQIGGDYTYVIMSPRNNNSFSGSLGGAQALFEYKKLDYVYGGAKFAWRMGNMTGDDGDRSLLDIDIESRIGYVASGVHGECHPWTVIPFTGFGFRYLYETVPTLSFEYDEFYVPVGLLTQYRFNTFFALGFDLTWMPQVYPTVFIDPLKGARWITTHQIGNVLVEAPMTFNVYDKYNLTMVVKPYFEFWQDGKTTAVTATNVNLGIPGNYYYFMGIDINLGYSF